MPISVSPPVSPDAPRGPVTRLVPTSPSFEAPPELPPHPGSRQPPPGRSGVASKPSVSFWPLQSSSCSCAALAAESHLRSRWYPVTGFCKECWFLQQNDVENVFCADRRFGEEKGCLFAQQRPSIPKYSSAISYSAHSWCPGAAAGFLRHVCAPTHLSWPLQ